MRWGGDKPPRVFYILSIVRSFGCTPCSLAAGNPYIFSADLLIILRLIVPYVAVICSFIALARGVYRG